MRVLVTGVTGFVGGHVVHALRASGKDVRALVRDPRKGGRLEAWGVELAPGDVTEPRSLRRAVEGCDTVVHLVAIRQGREQEFQRVMVDGMRGIRQVASAEIPMYGATELAVDPNNVGEAGAKVKRQDYFVPAVGRGAEILEGSSDEIADKLIQLMKAKGGMQ